MTSDLKDGQNEALHSYGYRNTFNLSYPELFLLKGQEMADSGVFFFFFSYNKSLLSHNKNRTKHGSDLSIELVI